MQDFPWADIFLGGSFVKSVISVPSEQSQENWLRSLGIISAEEFTLFPLFMFVLLNHAPLGITITGDIIEWESENNQYCRIVFEAVQNTHSTCFIKS